MSITKRLIYIVAIIAILTSLVAAQEYRLPANPVEGSRLFISRGCIKCHAIKGKGGSIGPDLGQVSHGHGGTLLDMAGIMWNHGPYMEGVMKQEKIRWPEFSGEEMASLTAYLYFVNYFDELGDPAIGQVLFENKGCIKCHSIKGEGGKIGPDLSKLKGISSPVDLAAKMWNHVPIMYKKTVKQQIPWPQFQKGEMVDILGYLKAVQENLK